MPPKNPIGGTGMRGRNDGRPWMVFTRIEADGQTPREGWTGCGAPLLCGHATVCVVQSTEDGRRDKRGRARPRHAAAPRGFTPGPAGLYA